MINTYVVKYEQEYHVKALEKYEEFKMESETNKNMLEYEIIVVNNSNSARGVINFIENVKNFVSKNIKLYLYKHNVGIEYFIGPILIDSIDTSHLLLHILVKINKGDFYVKYPESIETNVKEYFNNLKDTNKLHLFFD